MNPIEILGVATAVFILIKMVIFLWNPSWLQSSADNLLKNMKNLQIVYLIFLLGSGYFIFQVYRPVEVAAIMLFTFALVGFHLASYPKLFRKFAKEFSKRPDLAWTIWLWLAFAAWVLYTVYA